MSIYDPAFNPNDPANLGALEVPPSTRAAAWMPTLGRLSCEQRCAGLPTTAFLSCVASCEQGVDVTGWTPRGEWQAPVELPSLNLPSFGELAGLVKWGVVGLVALVIFQIVR